MTEMGVCVRAEDIAKLQTEIKSIFKRMDEQMELSKSVAEMAASVRVMAERMDNMKDTVETVESDVKELKAKPARRWDAIIQTAITAILSALIAFLVARVGMG